MITRADFAAYIGAFNANDFDGFGRFYAEDVLLELGARQIRGRQGILDFYRMVKARVRETLELRQLVLDESGAAAELMTEFVGLEDWPDFIAGPLTRGGAIRLISFVMYRIEDGRFVHIRSARYRML